MMEYYANLNHHQRFGSEWSANDTYPPTTAEWLHFRAQHPASWQQLQQHLQPQQQPQLQQPHQQQLPQPQLQQQQLQQLPQQHPAPPAHPPLNQGQGQIAATIPAAGSVTAPTQPALVNYRYGPMRDATIYSEHDLRVLCRAAQILRVSLPTLLSTYDPLHTPPYTQVWPSVNGSERNPNGPVLTNNPTESVLSEELRSDGHLPALQGVGGPATTTTQDHMPSQNMKDFWGHYPVQSAVSHSGPMDRVLFGHDSRMPPAGLDDEDLLDDASFSFGSNMVTSNGQPFMNLGTVNGGVRMAPTMSSSSMIRAGGKRPRSLSPLESADNSMDIPVNVEQPPLQQNVQQPIAIMEDEDIIPSGLSDETEGVQDESEAHPHSTGPRMTTCFQCRSNKKKCMPADPEKPYGICKACEDRRKSNNNERSKPCVRVKLTNARLTDHIKCGTGNCAAAWKRLFKAFESSNASLVAVTVGFSNSGPLFSLRLRNFEAKERPKKSYSGALMGSSLAIPNTEAAMTEAEAAILGFINSTSGVQHYVRSYANAQKHSNTLISTHYEMAAELVRTADLRANDDHVKELCRQLLRFWSAQQLKDDIKSRGRIRTHMPGRSSPAFGSQSIPMSDLLSNQIELLLNSKIIKSAEDAVRKALEKAMLQSKCDWFPVYIASFVLLHNNAVLVARSQKLQHTHGSHEHVQNSRVVRELHQGADNLLGHFHCCVDYRLHFDPDLYERGRYREVGFHDESRARFMKQTLGEVRLRYEGASKLVRNRRNRGDEDFFISQLYQAHWKATQTQ